MCITLRKPSLKTRTAKRAAVARAAHTQPRSRPIGTIPTRSAPDKEKAASKGYQCHLRQTQAP